MLYIIILTCIYLIIFYGYGSLFNRFFKLNEFVSLKILNGLLFVGIISLISAIFIPLNVYFEIGIIVVGFILAIHNRFWEIKWPKQKVFYLLIIICCLVGSMNAFIYDTFSYYFPTIKWLDDYGFVRGLANFDFNLGQTSFWHIIQASFNQSIDQYYKINVLITILFILYLYEIKKLIYLIFLPIFFLFNASPSPDLPVFVLSIIIILNWIIYNNEISIRYGLLLSTFLVLIKPIAFVLPIFFLIISLKNYNHYLKIYFVVSCLTILFFLKNIILTGNFTFPIEFGTINYLPFSVPAELYRISTIEGHYILIGSESKISFSEFSKWSMVQYYFYLFTNFQISIFIYCVLTFTTFLYFCYSCVIRNKKLIILSTLFICKTLVFAYISMQFRFVLDIFILINVFLLYRISNNILKYLYPIIFFAAIALVFAKVLNMKNSNSFMRMVGDYEVKNLVKPINYSVGYYESKISNIKTNVVVTLDSSSDTKQPAINKRLLNIYSNNQLIPVLIDSTSIKKGFKNIPLKSKDLKEVEYHLQIISSSNKNL